MSGVVSRLMEQPFIYRLWIAPFAEAKLAPIRKRVDFGALGRVLDVGCGPGTNTSHFASADYLGLDINPDYIASARARYQRPFIATDVTTYEVPRDKRFDFILINSFLHHIDSPSVVRILEHLKTLLTDNGRIHILELVMPDDPSPARFLARHDRGQHVRRLAEWRTLLDGVLDPVVVEPYPLTLMGVTLWNMVYYQGRAT